MIRQRGESERGHVLDDHRREHSTISEVKGRLSHSLTHCRVRTSTPLIYSLSAINGDPTANSRCPSSKSAFRYDSCQLLCRLSGEFVLGIVSLPVHLVKLGNLSALPTQQ